MVNVSRDRRPLAAKIDALFTERWPAGNRNATVEVAAFVAQITGRDIDRQYIYRIRSGKVGKVDGAVLEAIAQFFGKPLGYFSATSDDEVAAVLRESRLQLAGLRTMGDLTPEAHAELRGLLDIARKVLRDEAEPGG
ncbi:hypothetical protein ACFROC_26640 [Nocardia tengchongensis]|uniref:hypothetical protein n=1 Tax=Nocardia tengchongensis TaxID=2055889 RepID=UPI003676A57D